jgi:hypothetical protein
MLKWLLYVVAALGGLVALMAIIGMTLPKGHRASRAMTFTAAPAAVFAVIADVARYPEWRADVSRVELLPDDGRGVLFREHGKNGVITFRIEQSDPPSRMLTRIADPSLAFGGTWTYVLTPTPSGGTSLTITEDGEVYNPIFRFLSKVVFSPAATIEGFLAALKKKLA